MRPLLIALTVFASACTSKAPERTDRRSKSPTETEAPAPVVLPAPVPVPNPVPDPHPSVNPEPKLEPEQEPKLGQEPEQKPKPEPNPVADPGTQPQPVVDPVLVPPPPPPPPRLPDGEVSISKITCPGGAEIPAKSVVLKSAGGVLSVAGDDELRNRLLGGAPSLTLLVKDGVVAITSTDSLPGYCGGAKPIVLAFAKETVPPTCKKLWKPDARAALDQPKVFETELRWAAENIKNGETRALTNVAELTGDFTVRVEFQNFTPGGRGAFFRVKLEDTGSPKFFAFAMIGNNSNAAGLGPILMAAITNDGAFNEESNASVGSRSQPGGAFNLVKRGKILTVTAETVDGKVERKTSDAYLFSDGRYRLKLEAGSNSNILSLTKPTGIAVTKVLVTDKDGVELSGSDAFLCDSFAD